MAAAIAWAVQFGLLGALDCRKGLMRLLPRLQTDHEIHSREPHYRITLPQH